MLQGLALPLVSAALVACLPWRWSGLVATSICVYAVRKAVIWWISLTVTIDGIVYKENAAAARKRITVSSAQSAPPGARVSSVPSRKTLKTPSRPTDGDGGFLTPRDEVGDDDDDGILNCTMHSVDGGLPVIREWAPFSPSLPLGWSSSIEQLPSSATASSAAAKAMTAATAAAVAAGADAAAVAAAEVAASSPYWLPCDASVFLVRDIRYKQTALKIPSDFALYDCVGMDMVRDRRRIDNLMNKLPSLLPEHLPLLPSSPPGAAEWIAAWGVPRVLVITGQLPYKTGHLLGSHPEDDGGMSVVNYFVLSAQASELLSRGAETPSLRLWRRLVEKGQSTKDGVSFKVVGRIDDLEKHEVPESFHRFNNKPVLLTKSSTMHLSRLPEVLEIDYDVRGWVYPARSTLANYHPRAKEAELEIGYVVEGKSDEELPEQILGCVKINAMDITVAKWISTG